MALLAVVASLNLESQSYLYTTRIETLRKLPALKSVLSYLRAGCCRAVYKPRFLRSPSHGSSIASVAASTLWGCQLSLLMAPEMRGPVAAIRWQRN